MGTTKIDLGQPIAIELLPDPATGVLRGTEVTLVNKANLTQADLDKLRTGGITRFRYVFATNANWAMGTIRVVFLADGWADERGTFGPADERTVTVAGPTGTVFNPSAGAGLDINLLNQRNWIDLMLPVAAGFALDEASIEDAASEIALSGPGLGTVTLDAGQLPVVLNATTGSVRFFLSGVFAAGDVTVTFVSGSWGYTGGAGAPAATAAPVSFQNLDATNNRTYFDVIYTATAGGVLDAATIVDADAEFELGGAGAGVTPGATPVEIATDATGYLRTYRYFMTGDFARGAVTVRFVAGGWSTSGGTAYANLEALTRTSPCSARRARSSARAAARRPARARSTAAATSTSASPPTRRASCWTRARSPTSSPSSRSAARARPASRSTPRRRRCSCAGSATPTSSATGRAAATPAAPSRSRSCRAPTPSSARGTSSSTAQSTPADFTVGGITTPNIGYLDVQLASTAGTDLDEASVTDLAPELELAGAGAGTATLLGNAAPTRLANSNVYRFYVAGDFTAGEVSVHLLDGAFAALPQLPELVGVTNVGDIQRFSVARLTGRLADPLGGAIVTLTDLNERGWFDVTYTVPAYADRARRRQRARPRARVRALRRRHHARRHARPGPAHGDSRSATSSPARRPARATLAYIGGGAELRRQRQQRRAAVRQARGHDHQRRRRPRDRRAVRRARRRSTSPRSAPTTSRAQPRRRDADRGRETRAPPRACSASSSPAAAATPPAT